MEKEEKKTLIQAHFEVIRSISIQISENNDFSRSEKEMIYTSIEEIFTCSSHMIRSSTCKKSFCFEINLLVDNLKKINTDRIK